MVSLVKNKIESAIMYKAYVFDAYGTLFDVHSAVSKHFDKVGKNPARVSEVWRNKQLEYTWVRSGMNRYQDFWELTAQALDFALESVPDSNKTCRDALLDAYLQLDCYSEVASVLSQLKEKGFKTAILSNGSPKMLKAAVDHARLDTLLDDLFSIDAIEVFKTSPKTYQMVLDQYQCKANEVAFQSSNRWDIAGAAAFGFDCNWINRTNQPDEYSDLPPKKTHKDLTSLLD